MGRRGAGGTGGRAALTTGWRGALLVARGSVAVEGKEMGR